MGKVPAENLWIDPPALWQKCKLLLPVTPQGYPLLSAGALMLASSWLSLPLRSGRVNSFHSLQMHRVLWTASTLSHLPTPPPKFFSHG